MRRSRRYTGTVHVRRGASTACPRRWPEALDTFDDLWGSDYDYQVLEVALNRYMSLSKNEVLAVRGYGRFTAGDVPFWGMSCFGMHNDLRGDAG